MTPNKKQRENLAKLADHLAALPKDYEEFHMGYFKASKRPGYYAEYDPHEKAPACGTVACAVGHGPSAGIRLYGDKTWWGYCERVFGIDSASDEFEWMFGGTWRSYNNTPQGAAARINLYLDEGIPEDFTDDSFGYGTYADLGADA